MATVVGGELVDDGVVVVEDRGRVVVVFAALVVVVAPGAVEVVDPPELLGDGEVVVEVMYCAPTGEPRVLPGKELGSSKVGDGAPINAAAM